MTSVSSLTPYISVQEFVDRCDRNSIAQYATDAPDPRPSPLPQALYAHPRVVAAVEDACGQLEAACLKSKAYTAADLRALTGMSRSWMKRIVANLAMMNLVQARPGPDPPDTVKLAYEDARKALEALMMGQRIFALDGVVDAGLTQTEPVSPAAAVQAGMISRLWRPWYGDRAGRNLFIR